MVSGHNDTPTPLSVDGSSLHVDPEAEEPGFWWLWYLVAWDGFLPAVVLSAPAVLKWLWPGNPGLKEGAAVALPILVFFLRLFLGLRVIRGNACGPRWRLLQQAALFLAAVLLVLVDCMLILAQDMPPGALFATTVDRIVWGTLAFLYVGLMAFSLYPGKRSRVRLSPAMGERYGD